MEDPEEEEWEYEEYHNSSKEESNLSWLYRKGLYFGEKAVISGFVISSVPLFLPSIVIVSALGITVSVPAGIFLVTYTCTEKLMNKLLPIPDYSYTKLEQEGDEMGRFSVAGKDINWGLDSKSNLKDDKIELPEGVVIVAQEGLVMVSNAAECIPENVRVRDKLKGKRNRKKSGSCLKLSQRIRERECRKEMDKDLAVEDEETEMLDRNSTDTTKKLENLVPIVEMKSSFPQNALKAKILENGVLPNENTLWNKVDALRLIVGYKAARKPSLSAELRALYVFTGIEPASSSTTEEETLRLLMSIIGVK